ncbi:C45 family autoproteolytic acyltransferase/hydolase [Sinosporangium siamense]|uniref:Peptidase C45 hydrolase domain-containing protein n=1 Tax=Sinosporangium siamense TaxID=1367973 RepID=A0A919V921_9ACTN|nr:C45 family peptidase [Sinosporangium siamense]GII94846.1 hypothetical protein Ssi02_50770 [Sinosporangium siamense]
MSRSLTFQAVDVADGGERWASAAQAAWPHMTPLIPEASRTPQAEREALDLFGRHMPELEPVLHRLATLLDREGGAALLTHTAFKPFFSSCSQTSVAGALLRNYDFHPDQFDPTVALSRFLRPVIGMSDLMWGLLDGMNDAGLAVSLTFGGRFVYGPGFHVMLVVRYLLETCETAEQAWEKLRRLPVATAQNLTLVDAEQALTVHVGPDIEAVRAREVCVTNHQTGRVSDEEEATTGTMRRFATLRNAARDALGTGDPVEATVQALLRPPLYGVKYAQWMGTLYTAAYFPAEGRVSYIWPERRWEQSFARFAPGQVTVSIPMEPPPTS